MWWNPYFSLTSMGFCAQETMMVFCWNLGMIVLILVGTAECYGSAITVQTAGFCSFVLYDDVEICDIHPPYITIMCEHTKVFLKDIGTSLPTTTAMCCNAQLLQAALGRGSGERALKHLGPAVVGGSVCSMLWCQSYVPWVKLSHRTFITLCFCLYLSLRNVGSVEQGMPQIWGENLGWSHNFLGIRIRWKRSMLCPVLYFKNCCNHLILEISVYPLIHLVCHLISSLLLLLLLSPNSGQKFHLNICLNKFYINKLCDKWLTGCYILVWLVFSVYLIDFIAKVSDQDSVLADTEVACQTCHWVYSLGPDSPLAEFQPMVVVAMTSQGKGQCDVSF